MTETPAEARIRRLKAAIGDGPHAASFDAEQHLRCILKTLGDQAALELLKAKVRKAA